MNIKILDSWLREHLKTTAKPKEIGEDLSLTSLSVERIEKIGDDYLLEMEITTNRPDLFSVLGLAREASAVLPQFGKVAEFIPLSLPKKPTKEKNELLEIKSDAKLVNRICAVVMDIRVGKSSKEISERLETSGIRSLNNLIDITNYVMRVVGHPSHVFDFDRLNTKELLIREAKTGEKITTLDEKNYTLKGGEIVAADDKGRIVDLLGIMGLENSVVNENTKRILFFIDNNEPTHIRNASMNLSIRSEAATLNEKGIDPELAMDALLYGIDLFEKEAQGKIVSDIIDIYPNKPKEKTVEVSLEKIEKVIGVEVDLKKSIKALSALGFETSLNATTLKVKVPSFRLNDIAIEEDVIEEIARLYGYHNLPSLLPKTEDAPRSFINQFYWEKRVKEAFKYWGFTEAYTYSFVSEDMYEGPIDESVEVSNPLTEDFVYMRNTLIPSLLKVVSENKKYDDIKIFEIANTYRKKDKGLPLEILTLSGILKSKSASFYKAKGYIEQLFNDLGIKDYSFKKSKKGMGASVYIGNQYLGEIEVLDAGLIDFELNFNLILENATSQKEFKNFAKYPPITEDLTFISSDNVSTDEIIKNIKEQSDLVVDVSLKDSYGDSKTFHVVYQDMEKNLNKEEVSKIREKILSSLKKDLNTNLKG